MPATPSRIGFITQQFRIATAGPNTDIEALYGNAARDTPEPLESFFDEVSDAQALADERLALLQAHRVLVQARVGDTDSVAGLDPSLSLPTVRVIDDEQDLDFSAAIVAVTVDMNSGQSELGIWG